MNSFFCRIKNKQGSALAMVLVFVVVLTILGTSLLSIAVANTRNVMRQENSMKSYYLARSGALTLADHIVSTPGIDISGMLNKTASPINVADGSISVHVSKNADEVIISSIGTYRDANQTVDVALEETVGQAFDFTLLADDSIEIANHITVQGQIATNSSYANSNYPYKLGNHSSPPIEDVIFDAGIEMPTIEEPPIYNPINTDKITSGFTDTVSGNKHVLFEDGIDLGTNEQIYVSGSGVYHMYIKNGMSLKNHNAIYSSSNVSIMIYVLDSSNVEFDASYAEAIIIAPNSFVEFHNSSGNKIGGRSFHGTVVANRIKIHGNGSNFDPDPDNDPEESSVKKSYQIMQIR